MVSRPSRWGNPYSLATHGERSVDLYEQDLRAGRLAFTVDDVIQVLGGRDLCCWCPPGARCHADLLLRIANER